MRETRDNRWLAPIRVSVDESIGKRKGIERETEVDLKNG